MVVAIIVATAVLALTPLRMRAAGPFNPLHAGTDPMFLEPDHGSDADSVRHISRGLTAALAVVLGPFGGHRLYLGTAPKVPLIYGLTFGGFGVLVLIDLGHILFTKDLSAYIENEKVFMWAAPREGPVTPP